MPERITVAIKMMHTNSAMLQMMPGVQGLPCLPTPMQGKPCTPASLLIAPADNQPRQVSRKMD